MHAFTRIHPGRYFYRGFNIVRARSRWRIDTTCEDYPGFKTRKAAAREINRWYRIGCVN